MAFARIEGRREKRRRGIDVPCAGLRVVEFSTAGRRDAEVPAGRLDDAVRRKAWALMTGGISALGCEPGNMTEQVEVRIDGVTQRGCAPMGGGSAEFRRFYDEVARLVGAPAANVQPPSPPLPPLPGVLAIEVERGAARSRLARADSRLPPTLEQDAHRVADAELEPIWRAILASRFHSGASIEMRDGVALPAAPYSCGTDVSVRVTSGDGEGWDTRQRCAEGNAPIVALADAVISAASR
jgi:hypothetical protein